MRQKRAARWIGLGVGLLLVAAGGTLAFFGDEDETVEDDPVAPLTTLPSLNPGMVANGQSVVAAPGERAGSGPRATPAADPAASVGQLLGNQRMVRGAEIALRVPENRFGDVFDRVAMTATEHGGFVLSSSTASAPGKDTQRAQLVLRVPVTRFDSARQAVARLGEVESQSLRGADVTGELVDQEARLRSLQAQEETLRGLVGKATTVGEVLQVQPTLFGVRQQIEQLEAQRAHIKEAAELSTIVVSLVEEGAPAPARDNDLHRRLEQALDGAVSVVGGMIVFIGWVSPVAAIGVLGWAATRLRHRRLGSPAQAAP